jgi:hypothetical protein
MDGKRFVTLVERFYTSAPKQGRFWEIFLWNVALHQPRTKFELKKGQKAPEGHQSGNPYLHP